jgi:putative colanic acid biosynthesis glycosyltransferase
LIRILQVNTHNKKGGAARIALALHGRLNYESDIMSYFAYGRGEVTKDNRDFKFSLSSEVCIHALITRLTGFEGFGTYYSTINLINYITRNEFDIIHLHNIHGYYLNFPLFINFLKSTRLPVIWTFHDCWPFTGNCANPFECKNYLEGCGECFDVKKYPKNYLDFSKRMFKLKKKLFESNWNPVIVTPSKWLSDIVKNTFFQKYQIEVIPNGIEIETFKPVNKEKAKQILGFPPKSEVVLFVAADLNNELKGTKYFLKAINEIKNQKDLIIATVGKKYNNKLNIKAIVKEFGYVVDKDKLALIYNAADLFCISSLDEIFGLTVTEAMACGTPVVGFGIGGIKEQVTEGCGVLVPPKDYISLAAAIEELLNDEAKRLRFGKDCRKRTQNNYMLGDLVKSYKKIYYAMNGSRT